MSTCLSKEYQTKLLMSIFFWWLGLNFIPLTIFAQSPDKYEWWADLYFEEGKFDMAESYYQAAYALDSTSFELGFKYGRACWHNHHDYRAMTLLEKTIKKDQGKIRPEAFFYLGNLNMRNGRYPQALQYWKKYKQKVKGDHRFHPEKENIEWHIQSVEWAMQQVRVDSIQAHAVDMKQHHSQGQAYWMGDSIFFQEWDSTHWQGKVVDSTWSSSHNWDALFEERPVLHPVLFDTLWIGVGQLEGNQSVILYRNAKNHWEPITALLSKGTRNTMPSIAYWEGYAYLVFSSDRAGGRGGMDIWISRREGNEWGKPQVLDEAINTALDEIEPRWIKDALYFSSRGHLGFGEFDIYKVKGSPNNWQKVQNLGLPVNSSQNDIGFSIFEDSLSQRWIWSSARSGTGCCLEMYQYVYFKKQKPKQDSIPLDLQWLAMHLPLPLYFHNDEPQPNSMDTISQWTYADCLSSYTSKSKEYIQALDDENEWEQFVDSKLTYRYEQWKRAMVIIEKRMALGDTLTLHVRGFASPLAAGDYNLRLTQRRINALENELLKWNNGSLRPYWGGQLKIQSSPFGESQSAMVSDDIKNKKESIYSAKAREERRIEIEGLEWKSLKGQLERFGKAQ